MKTKEIISKINEARKINAVEITKIKSVAELLQYNIEYNTKMAKLFEALENASRIEYSKSYA